MVYSGLLVLVVLGGCRIGFDPIESSGPDAGTDGIGGIDGVLAVPRGECIAGTTCSVTASVGAIVDVTCAPDHDCLVECSLAAVCGVHCNGASTCIVNCPATGCVVDECDATCTVGCGHASTPSHQGATATCP